MFSSYKELEQIYSLAICCHSQFFIILNDWRDIDGLLSWAEEGNRGAIQPLMELLEKFLLFKDLFVDTLANPFLR